jgi:hypothetical protein
MYIKKKSSYKHLAPLFKVCNFTSFGTGHTAPLQPAWLVEAVVRTVIPASLAILQSSIAQAVIS